MGLGVNDKNGADNFRSFANYLIFVDCTPIFHLLYTTAIVCVPRVRYEMRTGSQRYAPDSHGLSAQGSSAECEGCQPRLYHDYPLIHLIHSTPKKTSFLTMVQARNAQARGDNDLNT